MPSLLLKNGPKVSSSGNLLVLDRGGKLAILPISKATPRSCDPSEWGVSASKDRNTIAFVKIGEDNAFLNVVDRGRTFRVKLSPVSSISVAASNRHVAILSQRSKTTNLSVYEIKESGSLLPAKTVTVPFMSGGKVSLSPSGNVVMHTSENGEVCLLQVSNLKETWRRRFSNVSILGFLDDESLLGWEHVIDGKASKIVFHQVDLKTGRVSERGSHRIIKSSFITFNSYANGNVLFTVSTETSLLDLAGVTSNLRTLRYDVMEKNLYWLPVRVHQGAIYWE